jgi:hypothetical protein
MTCHAVARQGPPSVSAQANFASAKLSAAAVAKTGCTSSVVEYLLLGKL